MTARPRRDILAMIAASRGADHLGRALHGPDRRRARRLSRTANISSTRSMEQVKEGELDLVVAGTHNAVMMVESEAKELSEEVMLGAVMFAHARVPEGRSSAIIKLAEKAAKDPWEMADAGRRPAAKDEAQEADRQGHRRRLQADRQVGRARTRSTRPAPRRKAAFADASDPQDQMAASKLVKKLEAEIVRGAILKDGQPHRRPQHQTRSARSRRSSASCRAPTARRCSPAARPRRSARPRSAPRTASR